MCPDCGRAKMLFETEKEANTFLKFNMDAVNPDGTRNMRVYYCPACCGWHISSHEYNGNGSKTDRLIAAYKRDAKINVVLPEVEGGRIFDQMCRANLKTKKDVRLFLDEIKGVSKESKTWAKQKYNNILKKWQTKK